MCTAGVVLQRREVQPILCRNYSLYELMASKQDYIILTQIGKSQLYPPGSAAHNHTARPCTIC